MTVLITLQIQYSASMFLSNNFNAKKFLKARKLKNFEKSVITIIIFLAQKAAFLTLLLFKTTLQNHQLNLNFYRVIWSCIEYWP